MNTNIISEIRLELTQLVDEKTRDGAKHFFKEEIKVYGTKTAIVEKMAGKYYAQIKHLGKPEVFTLCEELFKSDYMEESFIACCLKSSGIFSMA